MCISVLKPFAKGRKARNAEGGFAQSPTLDFLGDVGQLALQLLLLRLDVLVRPLHAVKLLLLACSSLPLQAWPHAHHLAFGKDQVTALSSNMR